ncbi:MAG: cysteine--tRNA ligase [Propionicimonas sp.]|uniref:cysteine--tRNA ligase n=1 Tax=Propionicimonas sp. TaxID=1955623 RepID=UPI003D0C5CBA
MTFRLYDSARRAVVEFQPLQPGKVSIYCCGPTVQSSPHLGHIRKEVNFDVLRRWLEASGNEVTMITNITDIDDKILIKSAEASRPWWAHAYQFEGVFHRAYRALGLLPPTYEPRATGHVPEMVALIAELIERGHAYAAADGSGDVYFSVLSWPAYGQLSGMKVDEMEPAEDADPRGKRDPRDFALWKGHKQGDPETAAWETPWGRGRPGWHLECSAMAGKYLGDAFDIHGGGLDLRFPHHENELAQSRAAGRPFASYWMHNAWVTMAGEKMSKSLGNTADVFAAVEAYGGRAVRLYLAGPHYRSAIELSDASLGEAAAQLSRIDSFLDRAEAISAGWTAWSPREALPDAFAAAMDDDLGTPGALAVLFGVIKEGNVSLDAGDTQKAIAAYASVRSMLGVLGLDPSAPEWDDQTATDDLKPVVDGLVAALLEQRQQARARKDWPAADAVRDQLAAIGLKVEDTPTGPRWSLEK